MEMSFSSRLKKAWNAFKNRDPTFNYQGAGYSYRPDRPRLTRGNERSIVTSVYNRIALDVSSMTIQHIRLDNDGRFIETIDSDLNSWFENNTEYLQKHNVVYKCLVFTFDNGIVNNIKYSEKNFNE